MATHEPIVRALWDAAACAERVAVYTPRWLLRRKRFNPKRYVYSTSGTWLSGVYAVCGVRSFKGRVFYVGQSNGGLIARLRSHANAVAGTGSTSPAGWVERVPGLQLADIEFVAAFFREGVRSLRDALDRAEADLIDALRPEENFIGYGNRYLRERHGIGQSAPIYARTTRSANVVQPR